MSEAKGISPSRKAGIGLRVLALGWLALLLGAPLYLLVDRALSPGLSALWSSLSSSDAESAFTLTLQIAAVAVPVDLVLGIVLALVLARRTGWLASVLDAVVDLPFAISPVVVGLALYLLYGRTGWLSDLPFQVLFNRTGMTLATIFVCLPYVVREVVPVLRERGTSEEEAAATLGANGWQTLRHITLPAIRPALAYGIVLSIARAIGEFGAVSIVSGTITGQTLTLPLLVNQRYQNQDLPGAYAASLLLAVIAVVSLVVLSRLHRRPEEQQ
jgi:sulfate transport system permease protein